MSITVKAGSTNALNQPVPECKRTVRRTAKIVPTRLRLVGDGNLIHVFPEKDSTMKRIKITLTYEVESDLNPDYYPEGYTLEDMVKIERKNLDEDPIMFIEDQIPTITKIEILDNK